MNKEEFIDEVKKLGINLTSNQLYQLDKFYQILIEENQKINLTRITIEEDVYLKHFYDSLTLVKEINLNEIETLCDVGTGAGFPGIVLKIVFPHLKVTLIDSLLKRVNYLNSTIKKLDLNNIEAIHSRAENYENEFDLVTTRAVASLDKLIPWCIHLVREDGTFVAMKGDVNEEIIKCEKVLKKNKCRIYNINRFLLPKENSNRSLVVIRKN